MSEQTVAGTTADPTLEFTKLEINGKTYDLIYDFEAIAQAEEETGIPLLVGVNWRRIGVRQIRAMLYASMLKAHPAVTTKMITPWIVPKNIPLITTALADAWMSSTPEIKEDEQTNEAQNALAPNPPTPEAPKPSES